jgi:hypothetical protein
VRKGAAVCEHDPLKGIIISQGACHSHGCTEAHLEVFNTLEIVSPGVPGQVHSSGTLAPPDMSFSIEHAFCVENMHLRARDMSSCSEHACYVENMLVRASAYQ